MSDEHELILDLLGALDRIAEALEDMRDQLASNKGGDSDDT
jgi:hypothetical protein